jgi:hypothetical protein
MVLAVLFDCPLRLYLGSRLHLLAVHLSCQVIALRSIKPVTLERNKPPANKDSLTSFASLFSTELT